MSDSSLHGLFLTRGGSCRTPHHRQEGLLPHAAPQTSGPNAARRTTDKWAHCRMPHHSGQMAILPHHRQEGLSPFSLPHCKQVGLTLLTANQAENTEGGGGLLMWK